LRCSSRNRHTRHRSSTYARRRNCEARRVASRSSGRRYLLWRTVRSSLNVSVRDIRTLCKRTGSDEKVASRTRQQGRKEWRRVDDRRPAVGAGEQGGDDAMEEEREVAGGRVAAATDPRNRSQIRLLGDPTPAPNRWGAGGES
jgi:hypothetical protein